MCASVNRTKTLVFIALFSALLGLFSQITLPLPAGIPLTLQTFAVALCGYFLGWKKGLASLLVCLTLGAEGLPLFSAFRGGVSVLFGPTGGFLSGFLWIAFFCGLSAKKRRWTAAALSLGGLLLCHATGILWYCVVTKTPVFTAVLSISLPYLVKDALCLFGARVCAKGLRILPA